MGKGGVTPQAAILQQRRIDGKPPEKNARVENTRRSHVRRNRGLQINRCM